jgi:hypothetical protein
MNVLLEKKINAEGGLTKVFLLPEREIVKRFGRQAFREISREAAFVCEGIVSPHGKNEEETRENEIAAWQCLINTGLAWQLQGWFGRQAAQMIEEGLCKSAPRT